MKILLINHYAGSPQHGMEYRPFYLGREWVKAGHEVRIVAASFSHVRTEQPAVKADILHEEIDGVRYTWLRTPQYQGNGIGRFVNMLAFVRGLFVKHSKFIDGSSPDAVIASSTYPLDIFPAHWFAKRTGAVQVFEVHDLWPLSPIELGGMSTRHPFILLMQYAEDFAYRTSDHVVSMLPKAEDYMLQRGLQEGKFIHIPNGVDVNAWQSAGVSLPKLHADVLSGLKDSGAFLVGYAGAHGVANALDSLIRAADLLRNEMVAFVCVGDGSEKAALEREVKRRDLGNVYLLPSISRSAIPGFLDKMDALYIGLQNQPLFRFGVSPNKLMDYMMAAKPVIYAISSGNDMVAESGCGISIPPECPNAIADAVKTLKNLPNEQREQMGQAGKDFILAHHDYRVIAREFLLTLEPDS